MTPEQSNAIYGKLNQHTAQILALQAVLLAITGKVEINQEMAIGVVEKTPLEGDEGAQNYIRSKAKEFLQGLIVQRVQ